MTVRFLPTQEWSVGERKCIGGFWYYWQHMTVRFLPTQEWSFGGRGIVGECCIVVAAIVAGGLSPWRFLLPQEWSVWGTGVCRWILALLATHDCEIPAYAGMVLWGNGELLADLALLSPPLSPEGYRPGDSCFRRNGLEGTPIICQFAKKIPALL